MYGRFGRRVFGLPWVNLIGTMCYSIYLIHIVVMQAISEKLLKFLPFHDPVMIWGAWLLVLLPAAIATSMIFYTIVERPFMGQSQGLLFLPVKGLPPGTINFKPLLRRLREIFH